MKFYESIPHLSEMTTLNSSPGESEEAVAPVYQLTREFGHQAIRTVEALWNDKLRTFWRSTEHRVRETAQEPKGTFFPTVTYRCTEALLDTIGAYRDWLSADCRDKLSKYVKSVYDHDLEHVDSSLDKDGNLGIQNPFTTSIYASVISKAYLLRDVSSDSLDYSEGIGKALAAIKSLDENCGIRSTTKNDLVHPFIQFHSLRAVLAVTHLVCQEGGGPYQKDGEQFGEMIECAVLNAKYNTERLLARHMLGRMSPSDAVALLFCAASLVLAGREEDEPYILKALEAGLEAQDSSGCWPLGRVVRVHELPEEAKIEISTYEIAFVVAETLRGLASRKREILVRESVANAVTRLVLAARYAQSSIMMMPGEREPKKGWCSDHPYGQPLIESWTTANVLQFAVSLHALLEEVERASILQTFQVIDPRDKDWPSWLRWDHYKETSEPDDDCPVLGYLDRRIVQPILSDPRHLPSAQNESVSALLFGPPGTSKTTIVKAVADGLGWPVIMLSPGDFIKEGLEYIEAQARSVFNRLQRLSRAVVLFDECDELFRDRKPSAEAEQTRGIAAFVTASMLPKLQELHDRGKVIFFICTNKFGTLDPAVKRGGRIDHIIGVGPPIETARRRIIFQELKVSDPDSPDGRIATELAIRTDRFSRSELIRACRLLKKESDFNNVEQGRRAAQMIAERMGNSLNISADDYTDFVRHSEQVSRPITERQE